jgi:hypothetical protein
MPTGAVAVIRRASCGADFCDIAARRAMGMTHLIEDVTADDVAGGAVVHSPRFFSRLTNEQRSLQQMSREACEEIGFPLTQLIIFVPR